MAATHIRTLEAGAPRESAAAFCVFLHGRGQAPEDMESHVVSRLSSRLHVILPAAPTGQWYDARAIDPLVERTISQLDAALDIVEATVGDTLAQASGRPVLLAGFSQGACLAVEFALRRGNGVSAMVALTGCRVGDNGYGGDELPTRSLNGVPVLMTNSEADPWVPLASFMRTAETMAACGTALSVEVIPGRAHEVCDRELLRFDALVEALVGGSGP